MGFVSAFLLVVASLLVVTSDGCTTPCPPFWTGFNGTCYRLYALEGKNFDAAEAHCLTNKLVNCRGGVLESGHLASIHSAQEQQFLYQLVLSTISPTDSWNPQVYIGMRVGDSNSQQSWTDGTDVNYPGWFDGEPNNAPNSRGVIAAGQHSNGLWADVYSNNILPYICQLPYVDYDTQ